MKTYRMTLNASVNVTVKADSEDEAITKAEEAVVAFSFGFELPSGPNYSDAVLYTSTEESAEVADFEDDEETDNA